MPHETQPTPHASGILTDREVAQLLLSRDIVITPILDDEQIGPTIDLRLGTEFVVKKMNNLSSYNPVRFLRRQREDSLYVDKYYERVSLVHPSEAFVLHPGEFALGCTLEFIVLPGNIGAQLEGRSSWAREGLNVHSTAGLIHPGHKGIIVFELQNLGTHSLRLYPGIRVAQLLFYRLSSAVERPYVEERYSGMISTVFGRPWEDKEFNAIERALPPEQRY
ncbi:dCTP deaminase [Thalassobaculum sp.]|uniref:dCTP deaminase n=1 Tax=Thalassobaculum sp. TaxID=2022740 RepID=UPI0032EC7069